MAKLFQRRPEYVTCRNHDCGRLLKLADYRSYSDATTNCHYVPDPRLAGDRVMCSTCGHYTEFYGPAEDRRSIGHAETA